jgi:hypothetical protein
MTKLGAIIILFSSLLGMGAILYRKIPLLAELPETSESFKLKRKFLLVLKEKMKNLKKLSSSFDIILQKILSKLRILTLKLESKISNWLQKLREKTAKKKEDDKYWTTLKESINQEKSENKNQPE